MKHEELNAVYGSNIKRLRKSKNLSQETLAEKADRIFEYSEKYFELKRGISFIRFFSTYKHTASY